MGLGCRPRPQGCESVGRIWDGWREVRVLGTRREGGGEKAHLAEVLGIVGGGGVGRGEVSLEACAPWCPSCYSTRVPQPLHASYPPPHTHVPYGVDHDTCPTLGNIWHSNLVWCIEERGDLFHSDMLPRRSVPFGINRQPHTQSAADFL